MAGRIKQVNPYAKTRRRAKMPNARAVGRANSNAAFKRGAVGGKVQPGKPGSGGGGGMKLSPLTKASGPSMVQTGGTKLSPLTKAPKPPGPVQTGKLSAPTKAPTPLDPRAPRDSKRGGAPLPAGTKRLAQVNPYAAKAGGVGGKLAPMPPEKIRKAKETR